MDAQRFAEAYADRTPRDYAKMSSIDWGEVRHPVFYDPVSQWSQFFSKVIDYTFTNNPVSSGDLSSQVGYYTSDENRRLTSEIIDKTRSVALYKPELAPQLNSLNFHTVNQEFGSIWRRLASVDGRPPFEQKRLVGMQTRLAIKSLELVSYRAKNTEILRNPPVKIDTGLPEQGRSQETWVDDSLVGQITKLDAAISLLEVTRQQPESLLIFPAPPKYETYRGKAADFLAYDTLRQQACGIQVKTDLRYTRPGEYDQSLVTFVDGMRDLTNYETIISPAGHPVRKSFPGLIAADFILRHQLSLMNGQVDGMEGMMGVSINALEIARSVQQHLDSENRTDRAAKIIGPRILEMLNKC